VSARKEPFVSDDKRQRGIAKFAEVMRFTPPDMPGDVFLDATIEHLFADVWTRPGLGVRERRLITLTVLMCLGNEMTLRLHLGAAHRSGDLSDQEIDELILHVAHYGGWPVAAVAANVVRQLRSERT
jgi:4-carboxymuconolactone decarboxylase